MKNILLGSVVASTLLFANNSAQININNDTVEIGGEVYLNNHYNVNDSSNYYFIVNFLNTEGYDDYSSQSLITTGFKVLNPYTDDNGISLGLGIKSVYSNENDYLFFSTPLSAFVKYELDERIYFDAEFSYAPRVLSFSDAEEYQDLKFKANYKVLEDGYAFIGFRNIETKYENGAEMKYDDSVFVGYEVKF
ncbi:MAG: hypothetical protein DRG78_18960 [Epsilonproteobacteria bacterium]|nr:MAG: hypothetical protein DRG78_18960 [Campylobacterota bacterium]